MADVVCVGILVADAVAKPVDSWPERGKLVLVDRMSLHLGGCASNAGVGLAKIGVSLAVVGKLGCDGFGDFLIGVMDRAGIDTRGIVRDPETNTSATMVMVHGDGERSFVHYLGANAAFTDTDVDWNVVAGARMLHIAGALLMPAFDGEPTARVLRRAKESGIQTCLDSAWDSRNRWMSALEPCLPHVDVFLPSIEEAKMITGREQPQEIAQVLVDHGVGIVGLKMGEQGCFIRAGDTTLRLPAYQIQPMDATGAGDAFVAGFLTGLVKGWDLERTGRFANAVGALATLAIGTTAGVRNLDETLAFMESTPTRTV